jgi:predicted phosphate transport protein (TIGR00153 family)
MSILKVFLPKDKVFFSLFEQVSSNIEFLSSSLVLLVNETDFNKRCVILDTMKNSERKNDTLTHTIFVELGKNFITPFDREDIHSLASVLNEIADYIYSVAKKINFHKVDPTIDQGIKKMAEAIQECVQSVNAAVSELRNMKEIQKVIECVVKINNIEIQVDDIFDLSIESLFDNESDLKTLIKKREIYQLMEEVTDKCEDAGNVMESIVVKYA